MVLGRRLVGGLELAGRPVGVWAVRVGQTIQYDSPAMLGARAAAIGGTLIGLVLVLLAGVRNAQGDTASAVLIGGFAVVSFAAAIVALTRSGLLFEHDVRRRFQAVCAHNGLTKKGPDGSVTFPRCGQLTGRPRSFEMRVRPIIGQSLADWERVAPALALAYGVVGVRVRDNLDSTLTLTIGYRKIEAHEFIPASEKQPVRPLAWRERLETVVIGRTEGSRPYALPLIDTHVLVAGITGAGKGSAIWSLMLSLMPAYRADVVRFWGFDPKRMELSIGRDLFGDRYACEAEAMVDLLEKAHDEMMARAAQLAGKVRKFEPSADFPLHVLVVDELGYLSSMLPDRKLRDRAERAISSVLVLGRAVGFVVVGALQDPRKETLGFRDLFPTRIAMKLPKPMVDLVLGHGMYEAGAQCDLIPPSKEGAGVAFVVDEASTLPVCVRMAWCSDDLIRRMAGGLPATTEAEHVHESEPVLAHLPQYAEPPRLRAV